MKNRFETAKDLLSPDGFICVHLNDAEMAYCKVLMDEVFDRENYRNTIALTTNEPSGFKATGDKIFSTANYVLIYSKGDIKAKIKKAYIQSGYDTMYNQVLLNKHSPYSKWKWININEFVAKENGFTSTKEAKQKVGKENFNELVAQFALENAERVFRTAAIKGGARQKRIKTIEKSKKEKHKVFVHPNDDIPNFYILNGEGIVFYENKIYNIDGVMVAGSLITDVWTDISWTGIANEGGVTLKNGKKPEKLMYRIIDMFTKEGDIVMDYHAGSGTTIAVAHKLKRHYVGIEQLNYYENDSFVRLSNVVNGDKTGISKAVKWKGGGSFVYMELKEWNEEYISEVKKADTARKLLKIYEKMKKESFFRYDINLSKFDEKDFEKLPLKDQKQIICDCLDKNHLYVNLSEIDDSTYKVSAEDKKLNKEFYKTAV